jgi:hypothetical protein
MSDLPAAARSKNPKTMSRDDLHPAQRSHADSRDVVAIIENDHTYILSPTGHFASAVSQVRAERADQGI